MRKLIYVFLSSLFLLSCLNESDKKKSIIEITNSEENNVKKESVILETIRENEQTEKLERQEKEKEAELLKMLAERKRLKKEKHLQYLHIDSLQGKSYKYYIENSETHALVKDFYKGEFLPSDDNKTFELLDILTEKNEIVYPFYFHCFNSICKLSDGALAEVMGEPCLQMIYNYPNYTFQFFTRNPELFEKYTDLIGYELYFQEESTSSIEISKSDFLDYLKQNLTLDDFEIKKAFDQFVNGIEQMKKNMED